MRLRHFIALLAATVLPAVAPVAHAQPDLIVHNGKVVTADANFSVRRAMAVKDGRVVAVGTDEEVLATKGPATTLLDLGGKTVLPGLIDSHVHPDAAMTEFDHPVPEMESVGDVLAYVKSRAAALGEGKWVEVRQVFITRLREQRYPTRQELDEAAPKSPVIFATGPDASLNTLALKLSGIDKDFKVSDGGPGYAEKDPATGEPTGILRSATRYVKVESGGKRTTEDDRYRRTLELFKDYNASGLTTVCDRNADPAAVDRYRRMRDAGDLTVRLAVSRSVATIGTTDDVRKAIAEIGRSPLRADDPMLRVIGIKTFLDGGMLTGSAYMLEPWGVSKIYSITDPAYRGLLFIPPDRLRPIVKAAAEAGLQFTAHSVGDGAVRTLLDAYEQVARELPPGALAKTRPCVTHCNFVHPDDVPRFKRLGVVADIQPVWLYMDARTLSAHFGYDRLSRFQPLSALFAAGATVGGGSDHMQKIGARRAINPYDPFLGMATAVTRRAKWYDEGGGALHPEHALSREQAVRMYTTNNAFLLFKEKDVGSLEPGKFADFVVVDTDVLTCEPAKIADTKVLRTYLAGKPVFERKDPAGPRDSAGPRASADGTTLTDPSIRFTVPPTPYAVLKRGPVEAVVVDNRAVDDEVLPGHRAGYSGVAALRHERRRENLFVPAVAGLNFEHIHDGTTQPRDILFEPRNAPMELRVIDGQTAELYQKPTPHWGLESCQRFRLLDDGAIELTVECVPRKRAFANGYVGLFWASYVHRPESTDIHFLGHHGVAMDPTPRWVRAASPAHGTDAVHLGADDDRAFAHDADFPMKLVFGFSKWRYDEPWYFGESHGMAFAQLFRPRDRVRLTQSPSGGGDGNPAWDFQFFIPEYKVGQTYRFVMRAVYVPRGEPEEIRRAVTPHLRALGEARE